MSNLEPSIIFFDLDGTLALEQESMHEALLEACLIAAGRCGVSAERLREVALQVARGLWHEFSARNPYPRQLGVSSWEALWGDFVEDKDPRMHGLRDFAPEYRQKAWRGALAECNVYDRALALELAEAFIAARRARHQPYPETFQVLDALKQQYRLGMITNGATDMQSEKLRGVNLDGWFDPLVVSGSVGIGKPDPGIFRYAAEAAAVEPETSMMIGDSIRRDVVGAKSVGMIAVWINRRAEPRPGDCIPDYEISDLGELLRLVLSA